MTPYGIDEIICTHEHLQRLTGLQTFRCMDCGEHLNADTAHAAELVSLRTFRDNAIPLLEAAVSLAKTLNNLPCCDCGNHFPYGEDCYDLAVETEREADALLAVAKMGEQS